MSTKKVGLCVSYCSHGGRCNRWLEDGKPHDGLHSNGYCPDWSDAEGLTKAAADAVLSQTPEGAAYVANLDGQTEEESLGLDS